MREWLTRAGVHCPHLFPHSPLVGSSFCVWSVQMGIGRRRMLGRLVVIVFLVSETSSLMSSSSSSWNDLNFQPLLMEMGNENNFLKERRTLPKFLEIFRREGHQRQSDLEVVLNSGPLFSPDVVFTTLNLPLELPEESSSENGAESPSISVEMGEGSERGRGGSLRGAPPTEVPDGLSDEDFLLNEPNDDVDVEELSELRTSRQDMDFTKINATSGAFRLNFTQDSKLLVVSPQARSRLILTCAPINLTNCSTTEDTLLVNNVGDLRFGRNSFIYCGPTAEVRVVSLRRKISLRIRRDERISEILECQFIARKQRFLENEEKVCGKLGDGRSSKIIGGRRIAPGLFPYLAQLDMTKSSGAHTTCSGTLISNLWVLTAAHCLRGVEAISVYMGGTDRTEFTGNEMLIQAEKYILHKNWNSRTLLGDIALVKLSKRVKYTEEISPVCLPDRKLRNENFHGKKGVATGWGRVSSAEKAPRQAYRVKLPFLSDLRCFLAYRRFFRPKVMMCTESSEERAICYGDSGGPLLYLRNQRVYQVGISSYSSSKVCGESFDVFTRLDDNYVEWINTRIGE